MWSSRLRKLARRGAALFGTPWGIAVLAAVLTGTLLGVALGERRWPFFVGVAAGAVLTAFGVRRLAAGAEKTPLPRGKGRPGGAGPEVYDLESDRSTDSQRWPM
jgi:hypothetical protein